jgi:hypothetical protein
VTLESEVPVADRPASNQMTIFERKGNSRELRDHAWGHRGPREMYLGAQGPERKRHLHPSELDRIGDAARNARLLFPRVGCD